MERMAEPARWLAVAAMLVVVSLGVGGTSVVPLTVDTGDRGPMATSGS
jgi:hypothetical protein